MEKSDGRGDEVDVAQRGRMGHRLARGEHGGLPAVAKRRGAGSSPQWTRVRARARACASKCAWTPAQPAFA
eukprot:208276-Pleurochrysis_carterae.AAC.18